MNLHASDRSCCALLVDDDAVGDGMGVLWHADDMWTRHTTLVAFGVRLAVVADRVRSIGGLYGWDGEAADAARSAVTALADDLDDAVATLRRTAAVAARAGDDRASLSLWDPDDHTGAASELDARVALEFARAQADGVGPAEPAPSGPAAILDAVNRARMERTRAGLVEVERSLAAEVDRSLFGGLLTDADAGLEQTRARLASIDALTTVLALPGRRLVHFEEGPRRTVAAVSIGDVDAADRLAVFVPGAGTTVDGDLLHHDAEAAAVVAAAGTMSGSVVAGISWLGYEAPQWNSELVNPDSSVASRTPATTGAPALARALDGLHGRRHGSEAPVVTVVAHSYGTVLAAEAFGRGAPIDDVVLMGSPGWQDTSPDIPAPYVAEARWDPVADLGWFGPDPSERSDAVLLPTDGTSGHGDYLVPGSTSARGIAAVVAGVPGTPQPRRMDVADLARLLVRLL
ncbi:alpha/beta hydrolase [Rhodococcus sp. MEB064]|uniref:alpha/beta hydrolase n=1 Tax=Rhodococcus sp. MEB064 TaxID=1587522 RepID=UPI000697F86D|nr:alpha/beta hydrolase [Rhodococcus sp. MEB064]